MKNYNKSAFIMMLEKSVKMLSQVLMMIIMTRLLGAEDLGKLMYCYALSSVFIFFNILGMDSVLIKKFVNAKKNIINEDIKNALFLRVLSAIICVFLVNLTGYIISNDSDKFLLLIISLYHVFLPCTVIGWYFSSQGMGYLSAYGLILGTLVGFIFRCLVLYFSKNLEMLGIAYVIESAVTGLVYIFIAKNKNINFMSSKLSLKKIKQLIEESYPLMLSSALTILYMKVDQIMLGQIIDKNEVGIYTAASRLSEAWFMFGTTLIGAYFPKLLETYKNYGRNEFEREIISKGKMLFLSSLLLAIITSFLSVDIITILYGNEFLRSAQVLSVSIWAVPFVFLGGISTRIYIKNGTQKYVLFRSLVGLIVNIVANVILINFYGAVGAAVATVLAQFISGYICNFIGKGREIFFIQSKIIFSIKTKA